MKFYYKKKRKKNFYYKYSYLLVNQETIRYLKYHISQIPPLNVISHFISIHFSIKFITKFNLWIKNRETIH